MLSKIVLCALPDRLTAGYWRMGRLVSCQSFVADEQGLHAFAQFLDQHEHAPIHLIADAVEEDYRIESLPHTSGAARKALLERRLNQLYRTTIYRAASLIGREKDKRKDDIFLFQALNNPETIAPWIEVIQHLHLPLAGVYLLPLVSQFLLDRIKPGSPHIVLTDRQVSGLRQTYFQDGKVRVSRLAPAASLKSADMAEMYAAETEKTRLYLLSQRLISRDTRLSLLVLSSGKEGDAVCQQIAAEQGVECIALDTLALGRRIGLREQSLQQYPELLYMQLIAKRGAPVNLAPAWLTSGYLIYLVRGGIILAGLGIFLAGLLAFAGSYLHILEQKAQMEAAARQTLIQQRLYEEVAKDFPVTPLSGNQLKLAVQLHQAIVDHASDPARMMRTLGNALDAAQDIEIKRLRWVQTPDGNLQDVGAKNRVAAKPVSGVRTATGRLFEIGFVEGEIRRFSGDYRAAMESVNRFAELLRRDAGVEQVEVLQQPVNVSSLSNLQGSTLDAQDRQIPAASFKLRVVLKPIGKQP